MNNFRELLQRAGRLPNRNLPEKDPELYQEIRKYLIRTHNEHLIIKILGAGRYPSFSTDTNDRDTTDERGDTLAAIKYLQHYKIFLGDLLFVECFTDPWGFQGTNFVGTLSSINLSGFGWGYNGTGPNAFIQALKSLHALSPRARNSILNESRKNWVLLI